MATTGDRVPRDLEGLGAELREAWRSDQESLTDEAEVSWRHRRNLDDLLVGHMYSGDVLAVSVAGHTFTGSVAAVGADLVALATSDGRVDIRTASGPGSRAPTTRTPLLIRVLRRGGEEEGLAGPRDPSSFDARLLELEAAEEDLVVGSDALAEELVGTIRLGADHVTIERGDDVAVLSLTSIAYVRPSVTSI